MEDLALFGLSDDVVAKAIAWFVGLQMVFFGIGKGLTEIAAHTETKYDNMIANGFSKAAWFMGTVISKFGFGQPSKVTIKQAEKIEAKEEKK